MRRTPTSRTVVVALAALACGAALQPAVRAVARTTTYEKLGVFTRVLTYIENNYVEEVDPTHLVYGAIKGMLGSLDPHSVFMTPDEYEEMKIDTHGEFGGIGLEITKRGADIVVVTPIDDTPAARAGLQPGDVIEAIAGQAVEDLSLAEVVRLMRGAPGSEVAVRIRRDGFTEGRVLTLVRDHIRVNPVSADLVDNYAVVRIKSFQDRTAQYVRRSLQDLTKTAGGRLEGVVLDLRNNPGGLLDEAVAVVDLWVAEGAVVSTRGRGSNSEVQRAHRAGTEPAYPMVVLVNGGSASASEIVAGALQDHGRAVIMGTRTFGKGSVQTVIDLDDGSGLKLTIARYYTPKGRSIQERGIAPDVIVQDLKLARVQEEGITREKDLKGHIRHESGLQAAGQETLVSNDMQLKSAIDALRSWQIFKAGLGDGTTRAASR